MKSSTKLALVTAVGLITGLSSQAAMAIPSSAAFTPGVINSLRDNSAELAVHSDGSALGLNQSLVVGDMLIGYFYISSTIDPKGVQVGNGNSGGYDVVTGIFATQVTSVVALEPLYELAGYTPEDAGAAAGAQCGDASLTNCSSFKFGSGGTSIDYKLGVAATALGLTAADLTRLNAITPLTNSKSMLAFFEQTSNVFNPAPATVQAALNTASAGTVRLVVGDSAKIGTNPTPTWTALGPGDPTQLGGIPVGVQGGSFSFKENILYTAWPTAGVQATANGTLSNPAGGPFPIADQTSFSFGVSVPEPGTLALLSLGLSAFGFSRKRQS